MNKYSSPHYPVPDVTPSLTMNPSSQNSSGQNFEPNGQPHKAKQTGSFDPDLAAKIEALEKRQAMQRTCPSCGAVARQARLTCEMCGNYFERGVEETVWDRVENRQSGKNVGLSDEEAQVVALKSYMVKRIAAKIIDIVIVGSLITMEMLTFFSLARSFGGVPQLAAIMLGLFTYAMPILILITVLGYQAAFESSPVQASLGKLLLGLFVVDVEGKQARFEPVVFKTFLSSLPVLGFISVYAYFFFSRMRYGIHLDAVSTSVLVVSGLACFVTFLAMHIIIGPEKRRQTISDMLSGMTVRER
ncbi:MAG: RDD family protein [Cyanobacteria bacterium REEB67]|nr:RDD family protein [Cyanobacteria bacterium REEB67]